MEPAEVVLRFLESMGRRSEAEFYLALFRSEPKERFAAISVDASVARHAMDAVVLDLHFLAALGLFPTVFLGLLEPTEAAEHAARVRRRLERAGVPSLIVPRGPELARAIAEAAGGGRIPIVAWEPGGSVEERIGEAGALLGQLRARKMIFLHRRGAMQQRGGRLDVVNLTTDLQALLGARELSRKERLLLVQSRRLVFELVPHKLLVAITSPLDLLRELFTVKGAGTLLRRGAAIERHASIAALDAERLRALLASSFGRPPLESFFARPFAAVYLAEGYRGVAILEDTPLGAYLTKFAVDREAQGEGMGRDLWEAVAADHPAVFWRARADNPIGAWYTKLCDGLVRFADWSVFWKGLPPERIAAAIEHARTRPVDLAD
jgi:acetylglutamate kinase